MSRTYNTRPRWVKLNDPKFPTVEHHQHYAIRREKSGKMETRIRHKWVGGDLWTVPEEYEVPHYYTWVEAVPCTIDMPEVSNQHWKFNKEKLCDKRELIWSCSCCSRKEYKRLTNKARRAKVHSKMDREAKNYATADVDDWWDVDIQVDSKYDSSYWWD